ncbi:hypothetical protein A2434_00820 [Candidatus Woesebacteria bacterium RIFOXYC1_FULL_41_14]|uniref:DUF1648 domain-containing protein n=2 Tax=Candidatus Woeseibacteriota TaxID=1752722 RepID=A0A1F8DGE2_9BACT|nr:MAG: hypothetical protein A2393_03000 [Candidatus Woesebacteria bacterium RIFOXYB1_FULL_41_13]OGM83891.1 MAG: hypothetical protein A2434_00820 [Candidatus Woesebacteria bacterium RIFOXYC1_FULL_41_14]OGM87089.1 MAG: hypothetical protein A2594_00355 [Candidatus Woesebacteria bacterium RIFOXYD1_FULL_41_28]
MWWKKVAFRNYFLAAFLLAIFTILIVFVIMNFLPPLIPLFYGKPTGSEQLTPTWFIFVVPGVSILITAANLFVNISTKDEFIRKIVAVSSLIISIMASTTVAKIIMLVGFF